MWLSYLISLETVPPRIINTQAELPRLPSTVMIPAMRFSGLVLTLLSFAAHTQSATVAQKRLNILCYLAFLKPSQSNCLQRVR